ncbi:MAG: MarR family transcriptional regulator [Desulfobulbaceae bacterium]|nr:MAG: MarR family transcriptional regulator [Desulfobulbaceae bacterium]
MEEKKANLLECCLFFTANSLARVISRLGDEAFAAVGMTPSYAFLLSIAIAEPGVLQKELAEQLNMAPSTVSRFVDALVAKGLISKKQDGRNTHIYPTESGIALKPAIEKAWGNLYTQYSEILGEGHGKELARLTNEASKKLQQG